MVPKRVMPPGRALGVHQQLDILISWSAKLDAFESSFVFLRLVTTRRAGAEPR